ncbi:nuclear transport factor 2 family protein [Saccharothrix deserti]|uniref:nuclear transport factor 2 family protein n=1 Tax=Saccharothrix deserti TaxID=2593674 RepID=UPI00192E399A|nr:nuclear transport factor 2 family protein [Saccharothrix deserti]
MDTTRALARKYVDALSAKDFATVGALFTDDAVWHQPGDNRLSGTDHGRTEVDQVIDATMIISEGTFELAVTGAPMVNGTMVAVPVRFSAQRNGTELAQDGIDVLRIEGDRIVEVWLFSAVQDAEDAFWGH